MTSLLLSVVFSWRGPSAVGKIYHAVSPDRRQAICWEEINALIADLPYVISSLPVVVTLYRLPTMYQRIKASTSDVEAREAISEEAGIVVLDILDMILTLLAILIGLISLVLAPWR